MKHDKRLRFVEFGEQFAGDDAAIHEINAKVSGVQLSVAEFQSARIGDDGGVAFRLKIRPQNLEIRRRAHALPIHNGDIRLFRSAERAIGREQRRQQLRTRIVPHHRKFLLEAPHDFGFQKNFRHHRRIADAGRRVVIELQKPYVVVRSAGKGVEARPDDVFGVPRINAQQVTFRIADAERIVEFFRIAAQNAFFRLERGGENRPRRALQGRHGASVKTNVASDELGVETLQIADRRLRIGFNQTVKVFNGGRHARRPLLA